MIEERLTELGITLPEIPGDIEESPALRVGTHRRDVGSMDGSCKQ